jgi:hypothetical protein
MTQPKSYPDDSHTERLRVAQLLKKILGIFCMGAGRAEEGSEVFLPSPSVTREMKLEEKKGIYQPPTAKNSKAITLTLKLQNEELHNLYSPPSIIRMIKSRRMRWVRHIARKAK